VGVTLPGMTRDRTLESLDELVLLAETAGAEVVDRILQDKRSLSPATLIGKGKVHEIAQKAVQTNTRVIIFDEDLTPVQVKNLENEFERKVVDRSGLILDIFARRARTREAQTQVELAQLEYYLPRLTRQWGHLSRQEGGIGTRGPGETQLESDRRMIRKRIDRLKSDLKKIEQQRSVRRKHRWDHQKIALVGYTNAGKSSLLNALSDAEVFVENQLFATLDTTIRAFSIPDYQKLLLIDTVGFIRKLPHHLIASFRSTLEETIEADLLLHVIDISHSHFEEQIGSVQGVLRDLGIQDKPVIYVFNKIDLLDQRNHFSSLKQRFQKAVFTSAVKGIGFGELRREITQFLKDHEVVGEIRIPVHEAKVLAEIYNLAHVLEKTYDGEEAVIRFQATVQHASRIQSLAKSVHQETE
jgi:GTP-binding protein HflX